MNLKNHWISVLAGAFVVVMLAGPVSAAPPALVIGGQGLRTVHLKTRETLAMKILTRELGPPSTRLTGTPANANCGVEALAAWHSMIVYFDRQRVVGLSFGPGRQPSVRTAAGLVLGDSLTRARKIYGARISTSGQQGGVWFVATSQGRIDGFFNAARAKGPVGTDKIATIAVGTVGCPALSP